MSFRYRAESRLTTRAGGQYSAFQVANGPPPGRPRRPRPLREAPLPCCLTDRDLCGQLTRRVRVLERENRHLAQLVTGLARERAILQDALCELD